MKKLIAMAMAGVMALSLVACGGGSSSAGQAGGSSAAAGGSSAAGETSGEAVKLAFITDTGNIDDHSFNQYSYEGVTSFAEANGFEANYFRPADDSDADRIDAITQAVNDGAKVVVMAGYLFAPALYTVQEQFPDVQFLALDVGTTDMLGAGGVDTSAADFNIEDYNIADYVGDNVALITYQEEQAGYLAGYATVKDGYTKLGFLGGIAVPAVVRYGYGFVQGAEAAAEEMGVDVSMKYWYSGSFTANDDIKARMDSWYADGTEVIFSCGGGIYSSAISAAEASANGGKIIGVDVDQSADGEMVITSATKALAHSVELALTDCMNNGWQWTDTYAAQETKLGAADECVALPMETSKFNTFDQAQYDELYAKLLDGSVTVDDNSDPATHPSTTKVTVDWQE